MYTLIGDGAAETDDGFTTDILGYFPTREAAETRMNEIQQLNDSDPDPFRRNSLGPWRMRVLAGEWSVKY